MTDTDMVSLIRSYESLPPNFSLVQNMVAGAFAGIAVSTVPARCPAALLQRRVASD